MAIPTGVVHYLESGDAITHAVAYVLLAMSVASWCFLLMKAWLLIRAKRGRARSPRSGARRRSTRASPRSPAPIASACSCRSPKPRAMRLTTTTRLLWPRASSAANACCARCGTRCCARSGASNSAGAARVDRQHRTVRRAARHRVGHLPRARQHRRERAGADRERRGAGRRGADHDRVQPSSRFPRCWPTTSSGGSCGSSPRNSTASRATCTCSCARRKPDAPIPEERPWHSADSSTTRRPRRWRRST